MIKQLASLPLSLLLAGSIHAQTSLWNAPTTGNWSTSSNWTPFGAPNSSSNTVVQFGNVGIADSYVATNDNLSGFQINRMDFFSNSTGIVFINPPPPPATLLNMVQNGSGQNPLITQNGSGNIYLAQFLNFNTPISFAGVGTGTISITGQLSGSNVLLTKASAGTLSLQAITTSLNVTGNGNWNLLSGTLEVFGLEAMGRSPVTFNGGRLRTIGVETNTQRIWTIGAGISGVFDVGYDSSNLTFGTLVNQIQGGGTFVKAGPGTLTVNVSNNGGVSPLTGSVQVTEGTLAISNANAFASSANPIQIISGASLKVLGNVTLSGMRPIHISGKGVGDASLIGAGGEGTGALFSSTGTNAIADTITMTGSSTITTSSALTISGVIQESGGARDLTKFGFNTLTLTNANTYTGSTTLQLGTTILSGAQGSLAGSSLIRVGGASGSTFSTINTEFRLDNSTSNNNNRLADSAQVELRSGYLTLIGNNASNSVETVAGISMVSGTGSIILNHSTGQDLTLNAGTLSRNAAQRPTLFLTGGIGVTSTLGTNPATGDASNLSATVSAGNLIGNVSNPAGLPILYWGSAGTGATGAGSDHFLTTGAFGLRPLAVSEYASVIPNSDNRNNIRLTSNTTPAGDSVVNALNLNGFSLAQNPNTRLRVLSGAIISNGSSTLNTNNALAILEGADREVLVTGGFNNINSFINTRNGFTLSNGSAFLTRPNAINGPITINAASLGSATASGLPYLSIDNETQLGLKSNTLVMGGSNVSYLGPSTSWNRNIHLTESGGHISYGSTFQQIDSGALLRLTGAITGSNSGMFEKSGTGTVDITGNNTFAGTFRLAGGIVRIQDQSNLGTGTVSINSSTLQITSNTTFGPSRRFHFGDTSTGGPNPSLSIDPGTTTVIQGDTYTASNLTTIGKLGSGTLVFEGLVRTDGLIVVYGSPTARQSSSAGEIILRQNGRLDAGTSGSSHIIVQSGGTFTLDNAAVNNTDRLRGTGVTLSGGKFQILGNASAASIEEMGVIVIDQATASRIDLAAGTGQQTILRAGDISRQSNSLVTITGSNLGTGMGPNIANLQLMSSITNEFVGGNGAAGTTTTNILRGGIGDALLGGNGTGWLRNDRAVGLTLLKPSEYAGTISSGTVTSNNVRLNGTAAGFANTTINSLIMENGASTAGATLTITTGNLASLGTGLNTVDSALAFGAAGGHLFVNTNLTINGSMSSTGGISKTGPGILTLGGVNTGGFLLFGGTTRFSADNQLGSAGAGIVFDLGAVLQPTVTGLSTARPFFVSGGGGMFDNNGFSFTSTGSIGASAGSGAFTKTGMGTFTHNNSSASNNYNGGLRVMQGTFINSAGGIWDGAPIHVASGATFVLNTTDTVGSIEGAGTIQINAALTVGNSLSLNPDASFSGQIAGTGSLTKLGSGNLTLLPGSAASNYTGGTSIFNGFIQLGQGIGTGVDGLLGNNATPIVLSTTSNALPSGLKTTGNFTIDRSILINTGGTGIAVLGTDSNSGTTTFASGRTITIGNGGGTVDKTLVTTMPEGAVVDVQSQIVIGGGYTGLFTLNQSGPGTLMLSNSGSSYTGLTVLSEGMLTINANSTGGSPPSSGPLGSSTLVINSGTLVATGGTRTIGNNVVVNGDFALGSVTHTDQLNITGTVSLGLDDRTISVNNTTAIVGTVTGSSGFTGYGGLVKQGTGTLVLSASAGNTYSAGTTVNAGKLLINNLTGSALGAGAVTINNSGFLGVLSVAEGGTGIAAFDGALTVNSGGVLKAGNSTGLMTVGGGMTMNLGSILQTEINGFNTPGLDYTQVISLSSVSLNSASLSVLALVTVPTNTSITILRNDSGLLIGGTFAGLPEGSFLVAGPNLFQITYFYNDPTSDGLNNDVALVAVPEPQSVVMLLMVCIGGIYLTLQHQKKSTQDTEKQLLSDDVESSDQLQFVHPDSNA